MALKQTGTAVPDASTLAAVFGDAGREVKDIRTWAKQSTQTFVRSQTQVARWSEGAKGKALSAYEALEAFGWRVLEQLADNDSAVIVKPGCEASTVLRGRREATGLSRAQLAQRIGIPESQIEAAEEGRKRSPIRVLHRLAQALALDADRIGIVMGGGGDLALGVRLRDVQQGQGAMSAATVIGLAEAAWVIASQSRLEEWLEPSRVGMPRRLGFQPLELTEYRPAWRDGMDLAHRARELLRIPRDEPIRSLKTLLEDRLAIPVVQVDLPDRFAGATMANGEARGVVANINGINRHVWVRRMTVAHELGHLLWDCDEDLNRLRVDDQDVLDRDWHGLTDRIETRANAFAAEFLAPQSSVVQVYRSAGQGQKGVSSVMQRFGISFTAATWQIHNGLGRTGDQAAMRSVPGTEPTDEWKTDETATADFFPIKETPISRRGRFAELCLKAYQNNLISDDTAAGYLGTDAEAFRNAESSLVSLLGR